MRNTDPPLLSNEELQVLRTRILERRIYYFYFHAVKWAPVVVMLVHWYGVFDYVSSPHNALQTVSNSSVCTVFLYLLAYVYMPLMMLPASYFFKLCWIFRIPFLYFFGVNAIRLYYGSLLITEEMVDSHLVIIVFTLIMYVYGFTQIACRRYVGCCRQAAKK